MESKPWGFHLIMDMHDCNSYKIKDELYIKNFIVDLCILIDMKRFGETSLIRFGEDPTVTGYTMVQLIETSDIVGKFIDYATAHYAEFTNSVYFDIFSCKKYDIEKTIQFVSSTFEAKEYTSKYIERY